MMHNSFSFQKLHLKPSPVWHLPAAASVCSGSSEKATWASRCAESLASSCSCDFDSLARAAAKFIPVCVLPRCLSSLLIPRCWEPRRSSLFTASQIRGCMSHSFPLPPGAEPISTSSGKSLELLKTKERSQVLVQGSVPLPRSWLGLGFGGGDGAAARPRCMRGRGEVGEGRQKEEPAAFYSGAHLQTSSKRPINNL